MGSKLDDLQMVKLDARINTMMYRNGDYAVYEVLLLNMGELMEDNNKTIIPSSEFATITGEFDRRMFKGEEYIFYCVPKKHKRYGLQYIVQFTKNKFDTPSRVRAFIGQFVADSIADQLSTKYGSELIQKIIDNDIDYSDVKGMGDIRFESLRNKVLENEYMKDIIMELGKFGITPMQMKNIVERFGNNAVEVIKENPYKLCLVHGIGFKRADEMAKNMGYDMESPNRIIEAIKYSISECENKGNSWIEKKELMYEVAELINVDKRKIIELIESNIEGVLVLDKRVTLLETYEMERYIAERAREMVETSTKLDFDVDAFILEIESRDGITVTEEQKKFFYNFANYRINLLVGYAGCGKSFLQKYALEIASRLGISSLLMAPTGKAAKVMEAYTGRKAYTLHRALGYGKRGDPKRVYEGLVIFDEGSMGDIPMYKTLLWSLENSYSRLLIVGDDFQLPSVGVGRVLYDLISSGTIPLTKLTKVFRQSEGGLLDVVTKIRLGQRFLSDDFVGKKKFGSDLLIHCVPQEQMEKAYKHYYKKALNAFSVDDIAILSPTKKAGLGTVMINSECQEIVNPDGLNEITYGKGGVVFREGDRVMNTKNTYDVIDVDGQYHDIVNGDQGVIIKIDLDKKRVLIDYDFAVVWTWYSGLENIIHCLSITMHKSQGSGIDCVISVTDKSHKFQLNANLLYTAWTRTKKACVALAQADVINYAIGRNANMERNTFLLELLKEGVDNRNNK